VSAVGEVQGGGKENRSAINISFRLASPATTSPRFPSDLHGAEI
jgi:hypothetical protein